jgi:hypothetical protein
VEESIDSACAILDVRPVVARLGHVTPATGGYVEENLLHSTVEIPSKAAAGCLGTATKALHGEEEGVAPFETTPAEATRFREPGSSSGLFLQVESGRKL